MRLGLGLGIVKSAASIYKGILDKFPNAVAAYSTRKLKTSYPTTLPADYGGGAAAAYSLRKVKSDYEGSAVKVRRSSDGGLQDIGFDSNGNLDTTALQSFVNAEYTLADEDFSSSTGWTLGAGVSITGGVMTANTSGTIVSYKNFGDTGAQQVRVTFTISNYVSGSVQYRNFGGGATGTLRTANGTYTEILTLQEGGNANHGLQMLSNFVGDIDDFEIVQITADGHVTRWYSQSDPVDTYTADFSGGVDNFVANGDNTLTGGLSITDEYGTTIDNVLELSCKNTNDTEHPMRKNNPFGASNPINGKTLKCSFKMLVPSGQTGLVSAALSDGNLTTNGILSDGKVTEQGRWTTFTDVAWTQTALQSRLIFMGLDSSDDPEFVADVGDKFYIADVVLTETVDAYNATDSDQPLIVEGGDVVLENNKPSVKFDGVDDYLQASTYFANFLHESESSVFAVASVNSGTSNGSAIISTSNAQNYDSSLIAYYLTVDNRSGFTNRGGVFVTNGLGGYPINNAVNSRYIDDQQYLITAISNPSDATAANRSLVYNYGENLLQNNTNTSAAATGNSDSQLKIFATFTSLKGVSQEIIIFDSDQSSNRKDIEWNINNHYSIYEQWDRKSCMNVRRSSDNATQDIGFSGKNINQTQLESFVNDATPVLDDYTGDDAAVAAYSLRKVRTAYDGNAIKVRRSSDNELKDIGFDANGDLDTTALTTFVNADVNLFTSDYSSGGVAEPTRSNFTVTIDETKEGKTECLKAVWDGTSPSQIFKSNFLPTEIGVTFDISAEFYLEGFTGVQMGAANVNFGDLNSTTNEWATYTQTITVNGVSDDFCVFPQGGTSGSTIWLKNIVITQTTADGHVTTWYDQAGINNATADCSNPSACEQPLIVEAGDVVLENNKPAIKFDGVDDYLDTPNFSSPIAQPTTFFVVEEVDTSTSISITSNNTSARHQIYHSPSDYAKLFAGTDLQTGQVPSETQAVTTAIFNGANSTAIVNGQVFSNGNAGNYNISNIRIGNPINSKLGAIQEVIFFDSDQSANRLSIEGNIGRYYNITGYRDGFVTKWYDQSGEYNHAENSTHIQQPQIVSNGSMLKENGKAAISFDGNDDELVIASSQSEFNQLHDGSNSTIIAVSTLSANSRFLGNDASSSSNIGFDLGYTSDIAHFIREGSGAANRPVVNIGGGVYSTNNQYLLFIDVDADNATADNRSSIYIDGGTPIKNNTSTASPSASDATFDLSIGSAGNNILNNNGKTQEIIIYLSDQSSNREDIEKNINTHFKIYS